jgi:hypothetical protein
VSVNVRSCGGGAESDKLHGAGRAIRSGQNYYLTSDPVIADTGIRAMENQKYFAFIRWPYGRVLLADESDGQAAVTSSRTRMSTFPRSKSGKSLRLKITRWARSSRWGIVHGVRNG